MARNGWHSIGDVRHLEQLAAQGRKNEAAEIARMALQIVGELRYLDGCVKRGRGEDLHPMNPGKNVFEYIKELERRPPKEMEANGLPKSPLDTLPRPGARPACEHGQPVGGMRGCSKCAERDRAIRSEVSPLVDEFWDNKGSRDLYNLMARAYRMGMKHKSL